MVSLLGILFSSACSVKEDRTPCPCLLEMDFICPDMPELKAAGLVVTSSDEKVWTDTVDLMRAKASYQVPVPRTDIHVRAWSGAGGLASDQGVMIPIGEDCPRIYMHDSDLRASGEYFHETVTLRKNHCVMTLVTEGEGRISADLRLKGMLPVMMHSDGLWMGISNLFWMTEDWRRVMLLSCLGRQMRRLRWKWMMERGTARYLP